jgi:hypothetical protein
MAFPGFLMGMFLLSIYVLVMLWFFLNVRKEPLAKTAATLVDDGDRAKSMALSERIKLLSPNRSKTKWLIPIGTEIDRVYIGGCMDTEISRESARVLARRELIVCSRTEEQHYVYTIETASSKVENIHTGWFYNNPETKRWEARK